MSFLTDFYLNGGRQQYNPSMDFSEFTKGLLTPPEQRTANERINQAVLDGANQDKQRYEQQYQQQIADELAYRQIVPQLLDAKALYEATNNPNIQQQAHDSAEQLRRMANAAGVDVSQYGSGVTLQDARNNLDTNKYKALSQLLSTDMNSEEFYNKRYVELRNQGYTDSEARAAAGGEASRYKIKRMARMQSAINTYGLNENGALNPVAMQLIGSMLPDDNYGVAAMYNSFATPKDEYNTNKTIAMEAIKQGDLLERMAQTLQNQQKLAEQAQEYTKENMALNYGYNSSRDKTQHEYTQDNMRLANKLQKSLEQFKTDEDLYKALEMIGINVEAMKATDKEQLRQKLAIAETFGFKQGTSEFNQLFGIKSNSNGGSNSNTNANSILKALSDREEALKAKYTVTNEFGEKTLNTQAMEQDPIYKQIQATREVIGGISGVGDNGNDMTDQVLKGRKITGNWDNDKPIVHDINDWLYNLANSNPKYEALKEPKARQEFIKEYLIEQGYTESNAENAVR